MKLALRDRCGSNLPREGYPEETLHGLCWRA